MSFKQFLHHFNRRDTRLFPRFSTIFKVSLIATLIVGSFLVLKPIIADENILKDADDSVQADRNVTALGYNNYKNTFSFVFWSILGVPHFDSSGNLTSYTPSGIMNNTTHAIAYLYTPPASGTQYIASAWNNFVGGKSAYAANGTGFDGLQPILPIWTSFRNAVYIISSIAFVIIGIMIMLQVKISPQAIVTAQSAIPQLIITLILVTFSYAIAGLLIDASSVFQGIAISIIQPFGSTGNVASFTDFIGKIPIISGLTEGLVPSFATYVQPNFMTLLLTLAMPTVITFALPVLIVTAIGTVVGAIFGNLLGAGLGLGLGLVIAIIVVAIIILVWLFQFLFGLFKCYATIIFKIVIAPLEIGMGAFPNSKIGFSSWIMDVIANLAVFPISFLFIILSNKIVVSIIVGFTKSTFSNIIHNPAALFDGTAVNFWAPSMLGGSSGSAGLIAACAISISTLLLLSKLPEMIPQFVFMIKPSPWGTAIGEGLKISQPLQTAAAAYGTEAGLGAAGMVPDYAKDRAKSARNSGDIAGAKRWDRVNKYTDAAVGAARDAAQHAKIIK